MARFFCLLIIACFVCWAHAAPNDGQWQFFGGVRFGCNGPVHTQLWLPNNDLIVGGDFTACGDSDAQSIARWDGQQWHALGGGVQGSVQALALWNNALYVGGRFRRVDTDKVTRHLAKFENGVWSPVFPQEFNTSFGDVRALAVFDGQLYLGGGFSRIEGVDVNCLARWNGNALGAVVVDGINGVSNGSNFCRINALKADVGGLLVGGRFVQAGSLSAFNIARFRIGAWESLGLGLGVPSEFPDVNDFQRIATDLYVTGKFQRAYPDFETSVTVNHLARWDGQSWNAVAGGFPRSSDSGYALAELNGELYIAGNIGTVADQAAEGLARYSSALGLRAVSPAPGLTRSLSIDPGRSAVFLGGEFVSKPGGLLVNAVARYDGVFSSLGIGTANGLNGRLESAADHQGQLYVGGNFTMAGGAFAASLARWDGQNWHAVSDVGLDGKVGTVSALLSQGEDLYVAGRFDRVGQVATKSVARIRNGEVFAMSLDTFFQPTVSSMAWFNGELVIGGEFNVVNEVALNNIARWSGQSWQPLSSGVSAIQSPSVNALKVFGNELIAGGSFSLAGGVSAQHIAAWNGTQWRAVGNGFSNSQFRIVTDLTVYQSNLVIAGSLPGLGSSGANNLAILQNNTWQPLLPNWNQTISAAAGNADQLYVSSSGGVLTNAGLIEIHGRWNGSIWQPMEPSNLLARDFPANVIFPSRFGIVYAGFFTSVAGRASSGIAIWRDNSDTIFQSGFE